MLKQQEILQEIISTTLTGVIVADAHGIIQAANPGATAMLGTGGEVVGRRVTDVVRLVGRHDDTFAAFLERSLDTMRVVDLQLADGRIILAQKHVRHLGTGGAELYVCWLDDLSRSRQEKDEAATRALEFQQLTSNIPAAVFRCDYDRARRFSFISPVIAALSGWTPDDFAKGRVGYTDLMTAADEARVWHAVGTSMATAQPYMVEYRLLHRDGSTIWVSESGRVAIDEDGVPQYLVGSIADNTAIKASNAEFEGTVKALDRATAVVEFDLRGVVLRANDNFLTLMGYQADEVVGHHHRIFCTPEQVGSAEYTDFWKRLRRGEVDNGEYLRIAKGGREVWIQATYNPIFDADGQPYKVMKFATDLSSRRKMEQDLRVAIDRAEDAVEARGNFLANMSHEIRTPMNAIIGFSETVLDSDLAPEQRRHIQIVADAGRSLLRLLNEILDMAKLEKGVVELEMRDFSLADLCDQIIASVRIAAENKGITLQLKRSATVPEVVHGDSLRLQQVLLNLLSNAVKFTERGSVTMDLDYAAGTLTAKVVDTGIGIPPEYLERIFDPFTQSDASTARRFGGTGLGTTIAQQLTKLMGGEIEVDSTVGAGTTFVVTVPLAAGTKVEVSQAEIVELPTLRVLAVDDTAPSLELLKITLERHHHRVTTATGGQEAIDACRAEQFDVILTDLQMPGVDGFEAARQIRADEAARGSKPVPIVALSAHVLEEHRQKALGAGMNGFAHKPLDPPALFAEIARVTNAIEPAASTEGEGHADSPVAAAPGAAAVLGTAVNWTRGVALWGEQAVLARNIATFIAEQKGLYDELTHALAEHGAPAVAPIAHRVRGASGNLSLSALHTLTGEMEHAAHRGDRTRITDLLVQLPEVIQAVVAELIKVDADAAAAAVEPVVVGGLDRVDAAELEVALDELEAKLTANQLAPATMTTLARLLPADEVRPLESALDMFDFDRALASLRALRARHALEPSS